MIEYSVSKLYQRDYRTRSLEKRLVTLVFDDPNAMIYGYEPVLSGETVVGHVASAEYGYSVGKFIALAWVDDDYAKIGTQLRVRYTGNFYVGVVSKRALFDPQGERMKG